MRLALEEAAIHMHVLSHTLLSPEMLAAQRAIPLARRINDEMTEAAAVIRKRLQLSPHCP